MATQDENPKQIPDPENDGEMIDNPDYKEPTGDDGDGDDDDEVDPIKKALKPIKAKLNDAFKERDELREKLKLADKADRDREKQKLKDEGKLQEAHELEMQEKDALIEAKDKKITELTRDRDVDNALRGMEFRTKRAAEMARKDLIGDLKQDSDGNWIHKSGKSIEEAVEAYFKEDDNKFLLKPKQSSGTGVDSKTKTEAANPPKGDKKDMSQEAVMARARQRVYGT